VLVVAQVVVVGRVVEVEASLIFYFAAVNDYSKQHQSRQNPH